MQEVIDQTGSAVSNALLEVAKAIPSVIAAIVIILIGILVAWAFKTVIVSVLKAIKIKPYLERLGLSKIYTSKFDLVEFLGDLGKWIVIIVFLVPALDQLGWTQTQDVVAKVLGYVPNIVAAVVLLLIGIVVADLVSRAIAGTVEAIGAEDSKLLATLAKWAVIFSVVIAALQQLGLKFADDAVKGIIFGLAAAFALAFGLGGQDYAKDTVNRVSKHFKK